MRSTATAQCFIRRNDYRNNNDHFTEVVTHVVCPLLAKYMNNRWSVYSPRFIANCSSHFYVILLACFAKSELQ